ncbi:uncharacterized protein [Nicotiana tomentosiformis]|uniref:uncharacterized protein n=1 Tax=Nicotiana tomentosiformis TaxID=4098 RepID=UPI00388C7DFB
MVRDCPRIRRGAAPQAPWIPQGPHIMVATPVASLPIPLARGGGSTYSYVSSYFAPYLDISRGSLSAHVYVPTPVGDSIIVDRVYWSCLVTISGYETRVNLLLFSMVDSDVILGMEWLSPYHAILDCHAKIVKLAMLGLPRLELRGALDYIPSKVMSFIKAHRMVKKGCDTYLAFVRDVSADTPTVELVPAVRDFPEVFPADLPGMPHDRISILVLT